jgi:transformation/transcription domain-associated protein
VIEKKRLANMQNARNTRPAQGATKPDASTATPSVSGSPSAPKTAADATTSSISGNESASNEQAAAASASFSALDGAVQRVRQPLDHVEDITSILKTGFPLLTLALETMVDQIGMRMKLMPEEDTCRQLSYLHADGMMVRIHGF